MNHRMLSLKIKEATIPFSRQEWVERQEKMKAEEISITFSYWDGSGHRRVVKMKKGNSISQVILL